VEDDTSLRELTSALLRQAGFNVIAAKDGASALELAAQNSDKIDLLLADVVLPGISGRKVAEELTALHPEMKTIYMSGYSDELVVQHGVLGPDLILIEKPFTRDSLVSKVSEVLTGKL
jgi:DNA-binding NtrC family response regulator